MPYVRDSDGNLRFVKRASGRPEPRRPPQETTSNANRTSRRFGIEMEGYINRNPRNVSIQNAELKRDGSLRNSSWDSLGGFGNTDYGVEVISRPITNIDTVEGIFRQMQNYGWHVDDRAGTHIHIDIADYSGFDKAKLLRFCKGIERIIFMFVKNYRHDNRYCKKLSDDWRKIFRTFERSRYITDYETGRRRKIQIAERLNLEDVRSDQLMPTINRNNLHVENSKYFWLNIYGSRHGTAEFRIFHAVEDWNEIKNFILMAHNIVDLAKKSTVEQLEYIILSLYSLGSVDEVRRNFLSLLGMQGAIVPFKGVQAKKILEEKLGKPVPQGINATQNKLSKLMKGR